MRYDYYNVPSNSTWNPKVGVKWTPMQQFALRGTAGTGFRAPYITEAGNAGTTFSFNSTSAIRCCAPSAMPNGYAESDIAAERGRTAELLQLQSDLICKAATKNLKPEKSDNYTAGFILEPIKGWSTTFDYYYIKLKNQIVSAATTADFQPLDFAVRDAPADRDLRRRPTGLSSGRPHLHTSPRLSSTHSR